MPLFGRHHEEEEHEAVPPVVEEKRSSGIFGRNRTSSVSAPSERSMLTVSSTTTSSTNNHHRSFLHRNRVEEDPVIAEAEQRLVVAEKREREADIALINAREAVKGAREHLAKLRAELEEQAKALKARQGAANSLYKRAKPLGRHQAPI